MKDNQLTLGEDRHSQAAHDLPLLCLLLTHHACHIRAVYNHDLEDLSAQAQKAANAVSLLVSMLREQAEKEHPGADWLELYTQLENYTGTQWPPKIIGKREANDGLA
ncbi:hypothetical protein GF1_11730 [Desulfolithobacter dissulfuricans]|uniref:Uncharacterized protein n=1 Tax=Desulfolithobacter dissulfuricans TaxID=2795293 RepID=A0A915U588_9BACT|nr:hypothetical protein [Desulfolithobacter dissulfuricans]BCO08797.1 hypothetical protein GF1_11730 [Desulfolithobacter dissulfuricans]